MYCMVHKSAQKHVYSLLSNKKQFTSRILRDLQSASLLYGHIQYHFHMEEVIGKTFQDNTLG